MPMEYTYQESLTAHNLELELPDNVWNIGRIKITRLNWSRSCNFCGVQLLTVEEPGFCCGKNGKYLQQVPALPPQSREINWLVMQPGISQLLRKLNLLFSFAAMETTGSFQRMPGPDGFVVIQGKVYHRLRPEAKGMGLRWVLYDGYDRNATPRNGRGVPHQWIDVLKRALSRENPFARELLMLRSQLLPDNLTDHIIALDGTGSVGEIAAILRYENTAVGSVDPRNLMVCVGYDQKVQIPTISKLWEPLAYPLFFDKGTLGWGVTAGLDDLSVLSSNVATESDIQSTQMWYYRIRLLKEERFQIFGHLANEYMVDMCQQTDLSPTRVR